MIPKILFLLSIALYPAYAQKQQGLHLGVINDTKHTLAYFAFAIHHFPNQAKLIRVYGYEMIPPSCQANLGWDLFPIQDENIHYFSAIAKVENGRITTGAIPRRSPTLSLPVPCYNQEKSLYLHNQHLRTRDILHITASHLPAWKTAIQSYWLSQNFLTIELPFILLYPQDNNSYFLVTQAPSGKLFLEIHKLTNNRRQ